VGLETLTSGEFKDIGSSHRKMTERDRELLLGVIQDIQSQFVEAVAQGRDLPVDKVAEIADGRIFTGSRAKELGLVDALGNFQDAVDLAKRMTDITGEVALVYPKREKPSFLDLFFETASESLHNAIIDFLRTRIEYRWDGF
jgi:protease-4